MPSYRVPGIHVDEISVVPESIVLLPASIPVFIGYTQKSNIEGSNQLFKPVPINSLLEFNQSFGGDCLSKFTLHIKESQIISLGKFQSKFEFELSLDKAPDFSLFNALKAYFDNGGGRCYVVSIGLFEQIETTSAQFDDFQEGLKASESVDEISLVVSPEAIKLSTQEQYLDFVNNLSEHCQRMQKRFGIMDLYENSSAFLESNPVFNNNQIGLNNLAAYHPYLIQNKPHVIDLKQILISHHVLKKQGINNPPENGRYDGKSLFVVSEINQQDFDLFESQFRQQMEQKFPYQSIDIPPSGFMAGIYNYVDADRGVWKAPANVAIDCMGTSKHVTKTEQESMTPLVNSHLTVNAVRSFTGKGILAWGARTLYASPEFKYVSVRRLFLQLKDSVQKGIQPFVFEPNDANTWLKIKDSIEQFMLNHWRQGAFQGSKSEEALFVRVGLDSSMTSQDVLEGRLFVEVGFAPIRPAEFIVFRIEQKMIEP